MTDTTIKTRLTAEEMAMRVEATLLKKFAEDYESAVDEKIGKDRLAYTKIADTETPPYYASGVGKMTKSLAKGRDSIKVDTLLKVADDIEKDSQATNFDKYFAKKLREVVEDKKTSSDDYAMYRITADKTFEQDFRAKVNIALDILRIKGEVREKLIQMAKDRKAKKTV
jgi:hypothetical protein